MHEVAIMHEPQATKCIIASSECATFITVFIFVTTSRLDFDASIGPGVHV